MMRPTAWTTKKTSTIHPPWGTAARGTVSLPPPKRPNQKTPRPRLPSKKPRRRRRHGSGGYAPLEIFTYRRGRRRETNVATQISVSKPQWSECFFRFGFSFSLRGSFQINSMALLGGLSRWSGPGGNEPSEASAALGRWEPRVSASISFSCTQGRPSRPQAVRARGLVPRPALTSDDFLILYNIFCFLTCIREFLVSVKKEKKKKSAFGESLKCTYIFFFIFSGIGEWLQGPGQAIFGRPSEPGGGEGAQCGPDERWNKKCAPVLQDTNAGFYVKKETRPLESWCVCKKLLWIQIFSSHVIH